MEQVVIELDRITKPPRIYREGLLSDNGIELRTQTILLDEASHIFSTGWHKKGCFPPTQFIKTVRKILFYQKYFAIMQLLDGNDKSLGCYIDIATPLHQFNGIYRLTDLILDLWIFPNGRYQELDVDEFEQVVANGGISYEWEKLARHTLEQLKACVKAGDFPGQYIQV